MRSFTRSTRPQRRIRRRRNTAGRANLSSQRISSPFNTPVLSETALIFNRRAIDLNLTIDGAAVPGIILSPAPGVSALPWVTFSPVTADTNGFQFGGIINISMDSINRGTDITTLFNEYQIRGCRFTVQPTMADFYSPAGGNELPEIITAIDPVLTTAPLTLDEVEAFPNSSRWILSQQRPFSRAFQPRLQIGTFNDGGGNAADVFNDNLRDFWCISEANNAPEYFGLKFFVRNFMPGISAGVPSLVNLRLSLQVTIAARRPH